jgi:hypothetical protein
VFTRSELNPWLVDFLVEHVDSALNEAGFQRPARARSARRRTDYGSQKIEFLVFSRPSYAPDAAHLYLNVTFYMPEVMDLARKIFDATSLPAVRSDGLACGMALDQLPNRPHALWLFTDRSALNDLAPRVQQALAFSVLPVLNGSNDLARFVASPAREGARVHVVAAIYLHLGQPDAAVQYLQAQRDHDETDPQAALLSPQAREGQRRRYAEALAQLERHLTSNPLAR